MFGRAGPDEIGLADDADECAGAADDRQAADVVSIHQLGGLLDRGGRADDNEIKGHDVGDGVRPRFSGHRKAPWGSGSYVSSSKPAVAIRAGGWPVGRPSAADTSMS